MEEKKHPVLICTDCGTSPTEINPCECGERPPIFAVKQIFYHTKKSKRSMKNGK
jgi:hypothetical protein